MTSLIQFQVNGIQYSVGSEVSSNTSLLVYLRNSLELRGTKYMCLEGGCGACIVAVTKCPGAPIQAVNSCLVSITSCHGWEITTIEKVGNRLIGYHPLQKTLAESNGSQCGHCSPGFVMAMYSLLNNKKNLKMLDVEKSISSNVCRCTGYRPILEAFKKFASDAPKSELPDIEDLKICEKNGEICNKDICDESDWCLVSKNPIFGGSTLHIPLSDGRHWYIVKELMDVLDILQEYDNSSYMLVAGNTAKGVVPRDEYPEILIDISRVRQLKNYELDQNLVLGAGNTLNETMDIFDTVGNQVEYFEYLKILNEHLNLVAHIAVRNLGTIGGNLMLKHYDNEFKSDIFLLLTTVGAQVTIMTGRNTTKTMTMEKFLEEDMDRKIIINIELPPLSNEYKLVTYKVMPRAQSAVAIVNAGFLYKLKLDNTVQECRIAYGGLSITFIRARETERYLIRKKLFTNEVLQGAIEVLSKEMAVSHNPADSSVEYRRQLAIGLFYKGLLKTCPRNILNSRFASGAINIKENRGLSKGQQEYDTKPSLYPLNEPIQKSDALIQCAGEASYVDDMSSLAHEVYAAFVLSSVPLGTIQNIDATCALDHPGVIAFYSAEDIPGLNSFTEVDSPFFETNEELLCSGEVKYYNQPLGIIVAETQHTAQVAAKLVKVTYSNVKTPVTDVKIAKTDASRTILYDKNIATNPGNDVTKKIKGSRTIYGQYHFSIETLVSITQSSEEGLTSYPSSQWSDSIQVTTSRLLNINANRIDVKIRRLGGTFGIKVSRSNQIALACSLVSYKLNRPCRFIQSLTNNMRAIGKRTPSSADFEVAFNDNGVIQYVNEELYNDQGYSINEPLLLHSKETFYNCYDKTRWNFKSFYVSTDTASNTWCRAPGSLEAIGMAETIMERIVYELSLDPIDVRLANVDFKIEKDILEMVNEIKKKSLYDQRKLEIEQFNAANRWKKQGLGFSLMKFKISGAMTVDVTVSVYHSDGTVAIAHGGIELGQAINTKAAQICAYFFKISIDKVQIKAIDTTINPNGLSTSASVGTQGVLLGVQRGCQKLLKRLEPLINQMDNPNWEELIRQAYIAGVDLQAHGYVSSEDQSDSSDYDVFGVALAQVTIDVLTGQWEFERVDILEDVGLSVNPKMDVGQIEGAFIMGMGYWTCENLVYDKNTGENLTDRTWNYWVPQARDIPQDFRIYFRKKSYGLNIFLGAKATGEPATCLSIAVPFAIRRAFTSARQEAGIASTEWHQIDGPFTVDKICLATATNVKDFKFY